MKNVKSITFLVLITLFKSLKVMIFWHKSINCTVRACLNTRHLSGSSSNILKCVNVQIRASQTWCGHFQKFANLRKIFWLVPRHSTKNMLLNRLESVLIHQIGSGSSLNLFRIEENIRLDELRWSKCVWSHDMYRWWSPCWVKTREQACLSVLGLLPSQ